MEVVTEIRVKIKDYLTSQGMINGHSGTGSRVQVQDQEFLHLSDIRTMRYPSGSSSSGSPGREDSSNWNRCFPSSHTSNHQCAAWSTTAQSGTSGSNQSSSLRNPMDPSGVQIPNGNGLQF